jgi:SAM-dependent methyltransferase
MSNIPIVQDQTQFAYIWNTESDLKARLWQIIYKELPDDSSIAKETMFNIITNAVNNGIPDSHIYKQLYDAFHGPIKESSISLRNKPKDFSTVGRSDARVRQFMQVLPSGERLTGPFLDVGCAEGSITAPLAKALNIPSIDAYGVDVRDVVDTEGFQFQTYNGTSLPFTDNFFQVISMQMVLHHASEQTVLIKDIFRVL